MAKLRYKQRHIFALMGWDGMGKWSKRRDGDGVHTRNILATKVPPFSRTCEVMLNAASSN